MSHLILPTLYRVHVWKNVFIPTVSHVQWPTVQHSWKLTWFGLYGCYHNTCVVSECFYNSSIWILESGGWLICSTGALTKKVISANNKSLTHYSVWCGFVFTFWNIFSGIIWQKYDFLIVEAGSRNLCSNFGKCIVLFSRHVTLCSGLVKFKLS